VSAVAVRDEVVPFLAGDGLPLKLTHAVGEREPDKGPVLLVHGAGVRASIFRPPVERTLVDLLLEEGYDVWLEDWRASIDIPHNTWTLDQAALFDHPAAVREVLDRTGAETCKAVVHCQGSTSFAMSAAAGLLPDVDTIVANAVSLHPVVPRWSELKLRVAIPAVAHAMGYLDPQWARGGAPGLLPKVFLGASKVLHKDCGNDVCRMSNFTYGAANDTLWGHDLLDDATHAWLAGEFAQVPLTFFQQILRAVRAGELVTTGEHPELPEDLLGELRTDARWVLTAGERNLCFAAESQRRTHAWLEGHAPGRHALHVFDGYGHLDVFLGRDAARDTLPTIVRELGA
jgi:hypothetical protein